MKRKTKLAILAGAGLIALGSIFTNSDKGYSKGDPTPWQGLQAEAGVDQWSPYALLKNQSGYISTRQDTSGEFNIVGISATNSLDDQLNAYTHPDSVQAFKRAWHDLTGR